MTLESEYDLLCICGNEFKAMFFDSVNGTLNPKVLGLIHGGKFNIAECPTCHEKCFVDKDFVFHDLERKLLIEVKKGGMRNFYKWLSSEGYFDKYMIKN